MPPAPPPAPPASLKLGNKQLEDLLLWKDVKTSGVVFGACTGLYILFGWSGMSAITVVAWLLMLVVATCSLWQHMAIPFGRPGPPVPLVLKQGFTEEEMKPLAEKARVAVNQALGKPPAPAPSL